MRQFIHTLAAVALLVTARSVGAQAPRDSSSVAGAIAGVAWDSLAGKPLAGALVQVVPLPAGSPLRTATSDSAGRYRVEGLASGPQLVALLHPRLDVVGIELPSVKTMVGQGDPAVVNFAVPGGRALRALTCSATSVDDSTALVLGVLRDAESDAPLASGRVYATWMDLVIDERGMRRERRQLVARTDTDGRYRLCALPVGASIGVQAELAGEASGQIELQVAPGATWQELAIGRAAGDAATPTVRVDSGGIVRPMGHARLVVSVRDDRGEPVRGARVGVWGTGVEATTDAAGAVQLGAMPSGTWTVEARMVGRTPARATTTLSARAPQQVALVLDRRAMALAPVTVYGEPARRLHSGLEARLRSRQGTILTRDDIERRHAINASDVLRTVPSVRVQRDAGGTARLTMRAGCIPDLVLDGVRIEAEGEIDAIVRPGELVAIEVYAGTGSVPARYTRNPCGVLLLWTADAAM